MKIKKSELPKTILNLITKSFSKFGLWWIFIGLVIFATLISPSFLTYRNVTNILRQSSILGVLAVGMTFVILTGGIDLAVGGVLGLSCVLVAILGPMLGNNMFLIIIGCILTCAILGAFSGIIISYGRLQPFITTLGFSSIAGGLGFIFSDGRPIIIPDQRWLVIGNDYILGVPIPVVIFLGTVILSHIILSKTVFGTYLYSIGNNEEATKLSGVSTRFYKTIAYLLSGIFAGLGGIVMAGRVGVGDPSIGNPYTLDVIAAVVVGGNRMGGGYGNILNTVLGVCIIGVINNLFNLLNISPYPQMVFKGLIIIGAVLMEEWNKSRK